MPATKLNAFGGMVPAVDDQLLPEQAASHSENTWLYTGSIKGINTPTALHTCSTVTTSRSYRIPTTFTDAQHLSDSTWLDFEDPDTDVIKAPVVGDTFERYYFASNSLQPKYNTKARIVAGSPAWLLGIPSGAAPSIVRSGGASATNRTSSYVTTWVTTYGEEGPPSLPVTDTGKIDATWTVTFPVPAAGDLGTDRTIAKVRLYRTVTSASGVTTYFQVTEQAIAVTNYADTTTDAVVATGTQLPSTNWTAPPTDLKGWVVMPNGIVAGWRENEIWFCEPYRPHAWPPSYAVALEYPIVGLGVIGQVLVCCTKGNPITLSGVHPSTMAQSKVANFEPCTSRGSVVSAPEGVYYASPNGLVMVVQGQATNITKDLITKDKWQNLAPIATLRAARLGTAYYAWGGTQAGVFEETAFDTDSFTQLDYTGSYQGVLIDPLNQRVAFNVLSNAVPMVLPYNDAWSGELFVIRNGVVYWIDTADTAPTYETFKWRSKIFQLNKRKNIGAMKVYFTVPSTAPALNPIRNTNLVQTLAADQYGLVRVYADDTLVTTRELRTSGELMRVASGFKAEFWQLEFEARVEISSLQVAASSRELAGA